MKKMKVAVLVHNDVRKDSRVRKGVRTLVENGVQVHLFGIGEPGESDERLEGEYEFTLVRKLKSSGAAMGKGLSVRLQVIAVACLVAPLILGVKLLEWLVSPSWLTSPAISLSGLIQIMLLSGFILFVALKAGVLRRILELGFKASSLLFTTSIKRAIARSIFARKLVAVVEESEADYDCIWCHDLIALKAGRTLKRRNPSLRLVWDAHEIYEDVAYSPRLQSFLFRYLIWRSQKHIDAFITISESFADFYKKYKHLPEAKLVMNATRFERVPVKTDQLRIAAGLNEDRKIMIFQGGFSVKRGIGMLMDSIPDLPEPWSVVFMGWGALEQEMTDRANSINQGKESGDRKMVIIPPVPNKELPMWTGGADLGIIPYENSGMNHLYCTPNKLWEFPNAGVPFIATDLVEIGKMVREWKTGFLIQRDFTAEDIVRAVSERTDEELEKVRENCLVFSRSRSWSNFEPNILAAVGIDKVPAS